MRGYIRDEQKGVLEKEQVGVQVVCPVCKHSSWYHIGYLLYRLGDEFGIVDMLEGILKFNPEKKNDVKEQKS